MRQAPSRHGAARRPAPPPRPAAPAIYLLGPSPIAVEEASALLEVRLRLCRLHPPAAAAHGCDLGWWRAAAARDGAVVAAGAPCPLQAVALAEAGWTGVLAVRSPAPFICAQSASAQLPGDPPDPPPPQRGHGSPAWEYVLGIPPHGHAAVDLLRLLFPAGRR